MSELKCTTYVPEGFCEKELPCACPVCGGFLKWKYYDDEPKCNKCKTELLVIPDVDEQTGEELGCGKICPISKPKNLAFKENKT